MTCVVVVVDGAAVEVVLTISSLYLLLPVKEVVFRLAAAVEEVLGLRAAANGNAVVIIMPCVARIADSMLLVLSSSSRR